MFCLRGSFSNLTKRREWDNARRPAASCASSPRRALKDSLRMGKKYGWSSRRLQARKSRKPRAKLIGTSKTFGRLQ